MAVSYQIFMASHFLQRPVCVADLGFAPLASGEVARQRPAGNISPLLSSHTLEFKYRLKAELVSLDWAKQV